MSRRLWLVAFLAIGVSGVLSYAQPALQPFSFHEGFEEKDPVQPWVSNGHFDVAFQGLTDETAFEGKKSFKLDITIKDGSYHYWRIPLSVPCEGKLKLSARMRLGEGTTASVGVGANYVFPPTHHSGCGAFESLNKPTGNDWKLIEGDLVANGRDDAAGVLATNAPNVSGDQVGVFLECIGLFIYGGEGQRAVVYLDDVKVEGEVPDAQAYQAEVSRRFAAAKEAFANRVKGWQADLDKARALLGGLKDVPAGGERALDNARAAAEKSAALLKEFATRPYASPDELNQIQAALQLARNTPEMLAKIAEAQRGGRPFLVHVPPAITNLQITPETFPVPAPVASEITLAACRGEYESATFVIYALQELKGLQVTLTDLKGPGTIPAAAIEPYVVKCWYQAGRQIWDTKQRLLVPELLLKDDRLLRVDLETKENFVRSTAPDGTETYLPCSGKTSEQLETVRPVDAKTLLPVDVPAEGVKQFWLTLHVPAQAKPGVYRGTIKLRAEGLKETELPLVLTVYPFDLAPSPLTYSIYYRGVLTPDGRGSISSEAKSEQQYEADMRDLAAHGVLYPSLYQGLDEPLLKKALDIRRRAGLPGGTLYSLGVGLGNTSDPNQLRELQQRIKRWQEVIAPFEYHELYAYGFDEATGEQLKSQRAAWQAAREAGAKTFVACYKGTFEAIGDLLDVAVLAGKPDPEEAKKYQGIGHRVFCYAFPQVGNEEPETYRRNFGLVLWKAGFDGAMDYAYQHSFGHIWNDFDDKTYRDHTFAYPTVDGVVDTVEWEGFREAVDDVRYVTTLEQAIKQVPAAKKQTATEARKWLDALDPSGDLYATRAKMAEWITKLR